MIKFFSTPQPGVINATIQGGGGSYSSGAVYWDGNQQKFKVVDSNGNSNDMYGAGATIEPGYELIEMMSWWRDKKREEAEIKALCEKYPNLAEAQQEYEILYKLVKEQK